MHEQALYDAPALDIDTLYKHASAYYSFISHNMRLRTKLI